MRLREYVVTVYRSQEQTVRFVADLDRVENNDALVKIAHAHAKDDKWGDYETSHGNLQSAPLTVVDGEGPVASEG
jgi:hypothetical protein